MSRRPLIIGNWKMNGLVADGVARAADVAAKAKAIPGADLALAPPFTLVSRVAEAVAGSGVGVAGQDCHAGEAGAHTGDVSAAMLRDLGCDYVILGHSERRRDHGETDADVRAKIEAAHEQGLAVVVCVGETEAERDAGRATDAVLGQLAASLPDDASAADTVIAYEPVWAIGSGRTPTTTQIQDMHAAVRRTLAARFGADMAAGARILYGGSMKPENAADFLALADVDGGLIGGASLNADDFCAIAAQA